MSILASQLSCGSDPVTDISVEDLQEENSSTWGSHIVTNLKKVAVPACVLLALSSLPVADAGVFAYSICMTFCTGTVGVASGGFGFLVCLAECSPYAAPVLP